MTAHFNRHGYIDGGVVRNSRQESLNMQALPPFLRTLLVTDGTVTKILEAYFWEEVAVDLIDQQVVSLQETLPLIEKNAGDKVVKREVRLRGVQTNNVYAYATSYFKTEVLGEKLSQELLSGSIGIGELLREIGLETFREISDFGQERHKLGENASDTSKSNSGFEEVIYRTYVISLDGRRGIQIQERFPIDMFRDKE